MVGICTYATAAESFRGQSNVPFQVKLCLKLFSELPRASANENLSGKRWLRTFLPDERFEGAYLEGKKKKKKLLRHSISVFKVK